MRRSPSARSTWSAASWIQADLIDRIGPRALDRIGFGALVAGIAVMLGVALGPAGRAGRRGLGHRRLRHRASAYAPQAVTVLAAAKPGEEGSASAAIQLSDAVGIALGTGVGGRHHLARRRASGWAVDHSVTWVFALALVGAVGGLLAVRPHAQARPHPSHLIGGVRRVR